MGPLQGFKILDLTELQSGPLCTMIMSDMGAEVIKLENPLTGGDGSRYEGVKINGHSVAYTSINRGKKSMIMDLSDERQKELFFQMVKDADAVIDNFKPGTMAAYGCDYETLKAINPRIVCTSITPFGQTGPLCGRAADDMTIQGLSGLMSMVGDFGRKPVKVGVDIADKLAGFYGCIGTLAALYEAMATGQGQQVDVAKLDSVIAAMEAPYARYDMTGDIPKTQGNRHPSAAPFGNYTCKDGCEIIVNITTDDQFAKFVAAFGEPEIANGIFKSSVDRIANRADVDAMAYRLFGKYNAEEAEARLIEANIPYSVANDVKSVVQTEHVKERKMLSDVRYSDGTILKCVMTPLKFVGAEEKEYVEARDLGADTMEIASQYMSEEEAHSVFDKAINEAMELTKRKIEDN